MLQIIFFAAFSAINLNYGVKMMESEKAIDGYLASLKLDDVSVASDILQQKNILGDDPLLISRNFNEIIKNFRVYLAYFFILSIFFISAAWTMTNKMVYKTNFKISVNIFLKSLLISLFYLALIFGFFFSISSISFTQAAYDASKLIAKYLLFSIFSILLAYFMFISLSLMHNTALNKIVQKTLIIGIKKIHYILAVYFINALLFFLPLALLYYFIEKNPFILLLSIILLVFSFIIGRVFLINVVEKLSASK